MTIINIDGYEPKHLSYSTIDGYRTCPMRFRIQKVIGLEQRPGLAGMGGNAVHEATEAYDLGPAEGWTVESLFLAAWQEQVKQRKEQSPSYDLEDYTATGKAAAAYDGKQNVQWWLDNGPGMVQAWIDWRDGPGEGWEIWTTPEGELAVELNIREEIDGIMYVMYIDRVMVSPAGQLVVLDIKTGRTPETGEQLGLYATGIAAKYGAHFRPDFGYYWTPKKGHGSPISLEKYTPEYLAAIAREAAAGINAGCFLAKPANNCKNWCGVAQFCPAVGGTLKA